ncbi:polymorphic toxin-type HINT domain-containing protein [Paenibacillus hunanensis]|uniref:polymorphic toxin-type HINT domain-containing protein n=1 Tax=Paenibacillus hunanensis TaxID=539262 RepID=UPI002A6A6409|nr:polymorphic toxin-type HINT domain-containing protein [Paenibacillus hunanensis]WPP42617.1 polymorphic toxin-type HINT domain-containing protein [Paenibacillus hunanensis]
MSSSATDYSARLDASYDPLDRVNSQTSTLNGTSFLTNYGYDKSRLTQIQTNGAQARTTAATANVNYAYTPSGQVQMMEKYGFKSNIAKITQCECFTAVIKVQTDKGEKNIKDIKVGDKILSKNEQTGEISYKTVMVTFNHLFYVSDKDGVFVKDLKVRDLLVQNDEKKIEIESIELLNKHGTVYNLTDQRKGMNSAPVTVYYHKNGGYVARRNDTGEIIQASDVNDPNWSTYWSPSNIK